MGQLVAYPTGSDQEGRVRNSDASYSTCRNAATGNTQTKDLTAQAALISTTYYVSRLFLAFTTSSIDDAATRDSATLALELGTGYTGGTGYAVLTGGTQAVPMTTADFDSCTVDSPTEFSDRLDIAGLPAGTYTFTLNAAGLAAINLTGDTKFCIRMSQDVDNTTPTVNNNFNAYNTTSAYDPKLTVNYTEAGGAIAGVFGSINSLGKRLIA